MLRRPATLFTALCLSALLAGAAQAGWIGTDIQPAGSTTIESGGVVRVVGWGADLWGNSDGFHYAYMPAAGDFDVSIHLTDLVRAPDYWTKAGLMLREELTADSANELAMLHRKGNNNSSGRVRHQNRPSAGSGTSGTGPVDINAEDAWLRLVRAGSAVNSYYATGPTRPTDDTSTDGWTEMASRTLGWADPSAGYLGLALTSHNPTRWAEATFQEFHDHQLGVDLDPTTLPMTSQDFSRYAAGNHTEAGGQLVINGDGADIWDEGDNFYYLYQDSPVDGDFNAVVRLVSQQRTNGWAKAGLMARQEATGIARHAHVSATPSNGVTLQWRNNPRGGSGGTGLGGSPDSTADGSAPIWLLLTRRGDTFAARWAPDVGGLPGTWSSAIDHTVGGMPDQALVGLNATSHNNGTLGEAVFDNFILGLWEARGALGVAGPKNPRVVGKAYGVDPDTGTVLGPARWKIERLRTDTTSGLTIEWFENEGWSGDPAYTAVVPDINRGDQDYPGTPWGGNQDHFSVRYSGQLHIASDGLYAFREEVDDQAIFDIDLDGDGLFEPGDGERILDNGSWSTHTSNTVDLAAGWYDIEFRQREGGGGDFCRLLWDPTGGSDWAAVPEDVLRTEFTSVEALLAEGYHNVGGPDEDGYFGVFLGEPEEWQLRLTVDYMGELFVTEDTFMGVPEPATCLLLGGGLAALVRRRRRRA
ncbi:MAG: PA14 domain-containing protein [Candidatus Brocadiia bacterium]